MSKPFTIKNTPRVDRPLPQPTRTPGMEPGQVLNEANRTGKYLEDVVTPSPDHDPVPPYPTPPAPNKPYRV